MSKKAKIMVAAVVAAISVGGLAPAASARTTVFTQVERINYRVNRGVNRLVTNVGQNVERETLELGQNIERETLELGQDIERSLNPR